MPSWDFWDVCSLIFGGTIGALIVDPLTGSIWTFYEKDVGVRLYPDTSEGRATKAEKEQEWQ